MTVREVQYFTLNQSSGARMTGPGTLASSPAFWESGPLRRRGRQCSQWFMRSPLSDLDLELLALLERGGETRQQLRNQLEILQVHHFHRRMHVAVGQAD